MNTLDTALVKFTSPEAEHVWIKNNKLRLNKRELDLGFDIYTIEKSIVILGPGQNSLFPTGIAIAVPETHGVILKERGSTGILSMNLQAGVIEPNYRGEWGIIITNVANIPLVLGPSPDIDKFKTTICGNYNTYNTDKAICQAILIPRLHTQFVIVEELPESDRGDGKFGSTGK